MPVPLKGKNYDAANNQNGYLREGGRFALEGFGGEQRTLNVAAGYAQGVRCSMPPGETRDRRPRKRQARRTCRVLFSN